MVRVIEDEQDYPAKWIEYQMTANRLYSFTVVMNS